MRVRWLWAHILRVGMLLERPPRRAPDHALNSLSLDITIVRSRRKLRWTPAGCHVQPVWHKNDAGHVHVCTRLLFSRTQSLGIKECRVKSRLLAREQLAKCLYKRHATCLMLRMLLTTTITPTFIGISPTRTGSYPSIDVDSS